MFTVLGSTGYIGRSLVASLRAKREEVFAPARGSRDIFSRPLGHVIYGIGLTADFRTKPYETVEAHVSFLADVLRQATFESLLYLSSTRIFSDVKANKFAVDPSDPSDFYNISKLMGEALCHASSKEGVRIARLSNVVGGYDAESNNFVFSLIRDAKAGIIKLKSHPDTKKDYIRIEDVVELLPKIASHGQRTIYNVGSGRQITHKEWLDRLSGLTGCAVEYSEYASVPHFQSIDIDSIQQEFRFKPRDVFEFLPTIFR